VDITDICVECKNYFLKNGIADIHKGTYTISGGGITPLDFIKQGQYFRISGSALNDRVICNTPYDLALLTDETFDGAVWAMWVPPAFITLAADIAVWKTANESADSANLSPFTSESFGGYSYSKGGGSSSTGGAATVWQDVFRPRLNMYRRINVI